MITVDTKTEQGLIGTSPPRLDAWEKVTGKVLYAGDMTMPGMLHARILWSAHAHANIRSIDTTAARALRPREGRAATTSSSPPEGTPRNMTS